MSNIIGHIVCIDDAHKQKLIDDFSYINIIDLDLIQNNAYNTDIVRDYKEKLNKLSDTIKLLNKKIKLILESKMKIDTDKILDIIEKKKKRRAAIRSYLKQSWREQCEYLIAESLQKSKKEFTLFIGYHIYPYDHRIKINLGFKINNLNSIIYNTDSDIYVEDQIRFYLDTYRDKIIAGNFNVNLLKKEHIIKRYSKLLDFYDGLGYKFVDADKINSCIYKLYRIIKDSAQIKNKDVYFATKYKLHGKIPINQSHPLEGYLDRDLALEIHGSDAFVYRASGDNFKLVGDKLFAYHPFEADPVD